MIALAKRRCTRHLPPPPDQVVVEFVPIPEACRAKQARGMAALFRRCGPEHLEKIQPLLRKLDAMGKEDLRG